MRQRPANAIFQVPIGTVWSGVGSAGHVGDAADALGARRCLVVAGVSASRDLALTTQVTDSLGDSLVGQFIITEPHAPYRLVLEAARAMRATGADAVVSLGGGSVIDVARIAALCVATGADSAHDLEGLRVDASAAPQLHGFRTGQLAHIALPTTLSAAELSDGGAATSSLTGQKNIFVGPGLAVNTVVYDPVPALNVPIESWVLTGVRALDHAVETILSTRGSSITDELSVLAVRHLMDALPRALGDAGDLVAREHAQLGAWASYSGVASGTLGLSHALGHQLGALLGLTHALGSCLTLPDVVRFVAPRALAAMPVLARALGVVTLGAAPVDLIEPCASRLDGFIRSLGFPRRLSETEYEIKDLTAFVASVLRDPMVNGTPGGPPTAADLTRLVEGLR